MTDGKVLVILGPTSTGKTDLGLYLAKKFNGEIISSDSRQVYTGLDIGTGKLPSQNKKLNIKKKKGVWEINGIKIWIYDVADPKFRYTVFDYVKHANKVVTDVLSRNKLPIVVGGAGLYLRALLEGLNNLSIPVDKKLREKLEVLSLSELQIKLKKISKKRWLKLNDSDRKNKRRLIRAIEIMSMKPYKKRIMDYELRIINYNTLKIGLNAPINFLRKKAQERLLDRFEQGMIEETKKQKGEGLTVQRMKELGLEYGMMVEYFEGRLNLEELKEKLAIKIGQFIKRQQTWFKKEKGIFWFDVSSQNYLPKVERLVNVWYHQG